MTRTEADEGGERDNDKECITEYRGGCNESSLENIIMVKFIFSFFYLAERTLESTPEV